ncbi:hypothetical protein [Kitasatospora sp. NPDC057015]|uniref:hypothetical protein n=1 Tax=Kitasatospora sp. NPDC057015 TaxID=3346001 RepID=UPI0036312735
MAAHVFSRGKGQGRARLEFPKPERAVLLDVRKQRGALMDLFTVRPTGRRGHFVGRFEAEDSAALVLLPRDRQGRHQKLWVETEGHWSLRVREIPTARTFTHEVGGTGPEVLDYRGPAGWATITHRATRERFVLAAHPKGPDRDRVVLKSVPHLLEGLGPVPGTDTGAEPTWQYVVPLDGPTLLAVEQGQDWSISVTPVDAPDPRSPVRRWVGTATTLFERPSADGPVLLDFHYEGRGRQLAPSLEVLDDDGLRREYHPGLGFSPDHRFLLGADERTAGLRSLRIRVDGPDREWELRLTDVEHARPLRWAAAGNGAEVLRYEGPPAVLSVAHVGEHNVAEVTGWGPGRYDWRLKTGTFGRSCHGALIGAGTAPELIRVLAWGQWRLQVTPLDSVRAFALRRESSGSTLVRWSGPAADLRLIHLAGHPMPITVDVLSEELRSVGRLTAEPPAAPADGIPVRPGALLALSDPYHAGWVLEGR